MSSNNNSTTVDPTPEKSFFESDFRAKFLRFRYSIYGLIFQLLCLAANVTALLFLALLLAQVTSQGAPNLNFNFLSEIPGPMPETAGVFPGIIGTGFLMALTALLAVPMGVGAAIYLEEYARAGRGVRFIKLNIQNLAGVPSVVYGILGLTLFVRFGAMGNSILAASMTLSLLILPIITIASQESLRAVPDSFRQAGYAVGMTRRQVVRYQVLPLAMPGMLTGMILALSRAIGESAPLILVGAVAFMGFVPGLLDKFTALPIIIYGWTGESDAKFQDLAAAGIIILLTILLIMNAIAIFMRVHFKKKFKDIY